MAEPTQDTLDAILLQEIVRTLEGSEADPTDRQRLAEDEFMLVLDIMATYEPVVRANTYAFMYQVLEQRGTEALHDTELAVLAWAPQDHQASQAVENGDEGLLYNAAWYTEYVSHHGSMGDARDAILKADGWVEPGFGGRAVRQATDFLGGVMGGPQSQSQQFGTERQIGRNVFGDNSRLVDILDTSISVNREDIWGMNTTADKISSRAADTATVLATLTVGGAAAGAALSAIKGGVIGSTITGPTVMKIAQSAPAQKLGRWAASLGGATKYNDKNLTMFQQQLAYFSHRTGLPADGALQWGRNLIGHPNLYNMKAAKVAGATMIFGIGLDTASGFLLADQYDRVWESRRADELEDSGMSQADAADKAAQEAAQGRAEIAEMNPVNVELDFDTDQVGNAVQTDSLFMQQLDESLFATNQAVAETNERVNNATMYEATLATAERSKIEAGRYPSTQEQADAVQSMLDGEAVPNDFEEFLTASEIRVQTVMEALGVEYYDPDVTGAIEDINAEAGFDPNGLDGWTLIEDTTAPKGSPRQILLPPEISGPQFGSYVEQWEDDVAVDPMIRVPEGYSARTYGIKKDIGQMTNIEADFISKAQKDSELVYEERTPREAEYRQSHVLDQINSMGYSQILRFQDLAAKAGFYGTSRAPFTEGYMTVADQEIVAEVMGQANVDGEFFFPMLEKMAANPARYKQINQGDDSGGSDGYVVPLSLRHIPGPKTIAEQAKSQFTQLLGREARPDELEAIAHELTGYHSTQIQELIALDMARYEGDNSGLLTGAQLERIEEPQAATAFDIGNKWADEIDLNERREANSDSFGRMLNATLGNRTSIATASPASNVQQIGRQ